MKKKKFLWMLVAILTSSLMTATFTACSSDDDDNNSNTTTDPYADIEERVKSIQPTESGIIDLFEYYQNALQEAQSGNGSENEIAYYQQQLAEMEHVRDSIQNAEGGNGILGLGKLKYEVISVPTTSYDGSTINMSTLVAYPAFFGLKTTDPEHVILVTHCTVTSDAQRPTTYGLTSLASDFAVAVNKWAGYSAFGTDCLVIVPDYEGYGSTKDRVHPYLSREVQAKQCVDAACWGQAWFNTNTGHHLKDNWTIVSVGYSQGGAVSAASYRWWLDHPEMHWVLPRWTGAICGDGPYDPYATLKSYCELDYLQMPCAPLLMLNGLCKTDQEMITAGIQPGDFCTPLVTESGIFEAMDSKEKATDQLDMLIFERNFPKYPAGHEWAGKPHARGVLNDDTYFYFLDGTVPSNATMARKLQILEHCLKKNALWYKEDGDRWTPPAGSKFTFFSAKKDLVVPYDNLLSVIGHWGSDNNCCKYEINDSNTKDHVSVGTAFFLYYHGDYVKEMLNNKWESGIRYFSNILW